MFERLVALGADVNLRADQNMTALILAVVHRVPADFFATLEAHRADLRVVNEDGFGALHAAAEVDHAWAVAWLAERGLDLEARTAAGHTPFHIACALGHLDAARALKRAGADVHAPSKDGSAKEIAEREGKHAVASWLNAQ